MKIWRHALPASRFITEHTIQGALVCEAASSVAVNMVTELRVEAAANVIQLFFETFVALETIPFHD